MIADMHCHYPMRLAAEVPRRRRPGAPDLSAEELATAVDEGRPGWVDELRADAVRLAARFLNFEEGWRVSLDELERGDVRAVFSVLFEPFAELDFDQPYGAAPEDEYFKDLLARIDQVEEDLARRDRGRERHEVVRTAADLDRVTAAGKVAFMHCVEGGFHLGGEVGEVRESVATLAGKGVVYITLAHLFWRQVATNAPALPFLEDGIYKRLFRQPQEGLTDRGRAAVEAMYEHRVLIDLSHMDQCSLDETFELLDRLDEDSGAEPGDYPVLATHAGYRFGEQEYMLSPETIERIAARDGVIGLILARHQLHDEAGVEDPDEPAETPAVLCRHIDAIREYVPGRTNAHVAIGSDLDGFIKPTVAGIEKAGDLATLAWPLQEAYGDDADLILSGNAMRVARKALSGR